jgi:general stress protein 26
MNTTDTPNPDSVQARNRLWGLIKDIRFAMFTARHSDGHLHSRPMTTQNANMDDDSSLWFFMPRSGEPAADLVADPVVNVVYADPASASYVSISGDASIVDDMAKKNEFWSTLTGAFFAGGVTDPDLALVRVKILHADYWDNDTSKAVRLLQVARAAVTGKLSGELGSHGEVRMG